MAKVPQGRINFLLEREHLKKETQSIYTLFENVDVQWHWSEVDIQRFDSLWNDGYSIGYIAKELNTDDYVIWLMCLDRALQEKVKPRAGGINGTLE